MDGKIPVLSRLLIISLLFVLSGNAYSDRDYSPGDVIFISLNQSESLVDFYYEGNLMTKVLKDDKSYLLFGVPYYTKKGKNQFIFESKKIIKEMSFNILKKKYDKVSLTHKYQHIPFPKVEIVDMKKEKLKKKRVSLFKDLPISLNSRANQNAALYKMLNVEHLAIYFIFTLVMIIGLFNVVGALIMMVLDKQDQMKLLLSLGASPQGIHRVFFILGLLICSIGGGVGLLLGITLVLIQFYFPFIYVPGTSLSYPVLFEIENVFIVFLTLMLLGTLCSAWATRGVGKKTTA